jgi:general secretion pathway protein M
MSIDHSTRRKAAWLPPLAAIGYGALIVALLYLTGATIADLLERRATLTASAQMLEQLQGRRAPASNHAGDGPPTGSALLEGSTLSVAGAALLQRIAGAVSRVRGDILSSHVELQGTQFGPGYVGVTATCEIEQPALQQLLYDLEAGMPYLFVDQLVVQQAPIAAGPQPARMRVLLTVYGQWQGGS